MLRMKRKALEMRTPRYFVRPNNVVLARPPPTDELGSCRELTQVDARANSLGAAVSVARSTYVRRAVVGRSWVQGVCLAGTDARRRGLHHRNVPEVTILGWVAAAEDGRHGEIAS